MVDSDILYQQMRLAFRECLSARTEASSSILERQPHAESYDEMIGRLMEMQFANMMDYTDCILAAVSDAIAANQNNQGN